MTQFFCGAGPPPREDEEDAAVDTPDIGAAIPWVDDAERPPRRRRLVVGTFNTEWAFDGVGKESRVSPWSGADGSSCPGWLQHRTCDGGHRSGTRQWPRTNWGDPRQPLPCSRAA